MVRMLFMDYGSVFNTIIQDILTTKLDHFHIPHATCTRIKDFLSYCQSHTVLGLPVPVSCLLEWHS